MRQLPKGFSELRPHQEKAIDEILEAFKENDVVFLDAPTGSGKTLIGYMVAKEIGKALYVCSDKSLQDQFARDFDDAKVLKGRSNYPGQHNGAKTAADCTGSPDQDKRDCLNCESKWTCPYEFAKREAMVADMAVTNTSYLLAEANYIGGFSGKDIIIADEGDTLEPILMGFVEYKASTRLMEDVKRDGPKKGCRKPTIIAWLEEFERDLKGLLAKTSKKDNPKRFNAIKGEISSAFRMQGELKADIKRMASADDEEGGIWLRDYDKPWGRQQADPNPGLILKPVVVEKHGTRNLWRHGKKWLVMSATIISADEMADTLGLPLDYATVQVAMTFPVANRPVIIAPIAQVTYKEMETALPKLAYAISVIARNNPGRILVHCVSYDLSKKLAALVETDRHVITYTEGNKREEALARYKRHDDSIMFAPSMARGIDLPDDLCRTQIIAKCPYPALGDKQISQRLHLPGGQMWYTVKTIRDVVQMTGRAVRHDKDWATTYILDASFARNVWGKWKRLFPEWWQESVVTDVDVRELILR